MLILVDMYFIPAILFFLKILPNFHTTARIAINFFKTAIKILSFLIKYIIEVIILNVDIVAVESILIGFP
jgi:hypothetical protein